MGEQAFAFAVGLIGRSPSVEEELGGVAETGQIQELGMLWASSGLDQTCLGLDEGGHASWVGQAAGGGFDGGIVELGMGGGALGLGKGSVAGGGLGRGGPVEDMGAGEAQIGLEICGKRGPNALGSLGRGVEVVREGMPRRFLLRLGRRDFLAGVESAEEREEQAWRAARTHELWQVEGEFARHDGDSTLSRSEEESGVLTGGVTLS